MVWLAPGSAINGPVQATPSGWKPVEPSVKPVGGLFAAGAAQFSNALRHFSNGNAGQKTYLMLRWQPFAQGRGHKANEGCECRVYRYQASDW